MLVFYGEKCQLWRNDSSSAPGCSWDAARQLFAGENCTAPPSPAKVQCSCVHLTDFSGGAAPKLSVASLDQMTSLNPEDIFSKLKWLASAQPLGRHCAVRTLA